MVSGTSCRSRDPRLTPLEIDDARILTERAEELAVPGVDDVDSAHTGGEQGAREAARSGAEIESHATSDANVESRECRAQLCLAAQDFRIPYHDGRLRADQRARVGDDASVDQHAAGEDRRQWILDVHPTGEQLS